MDPARRGAENDLTDFKRRVSPLIGIDLGAYKGQQMARRITTLMTRANTSDPEVYLALLQSDAKMLQQFIDGVTINVSEWFRNPEKFEELETAVLPELLEEFPRLKIWSAGCSIGSEIFSVAIMLDRLGALDRCELIGTDVDDKALGQAREAVFAPHEQKGVLPDVVDAYFEPRGDGGLALTRRLADRVRFERHNLLADPTLTGCNLIICRNVVIYFTMESKRVLHQSFLRALLPGAVLFVGSTERIFDYRELGLTQVRSFFYRKK